MWREKKSITHQKAYWYVDKIISRKSLHILKDGKWSTSRWHWVSNFVILKFKCISYSITLNQSFSPKQFDDALKFTMNSSFLVCFFHPCSTPRPLQLGTLEQLRRERENRKLVCCNWWITWWSNCGSFNYFLLREIIRSIMWDNKMW